MFQVEKFLIRSETEIQIKFTSQVRTDLLTGNFEIASNFANERALQVKSVDVTGKVVTLKTEPQVPLVSYMLRFKSTESVQFLSMSGEPIQDSEINRVLFVGVEQPSTVRDSLIDSLTNVYDAGTSNTLRKHISGLTSSLQRAKTDIWRTANASFLEQPVELEAVQRGNGPSDRLLQEGAYFVEKIVDGNSTTFFNSVAFSSARSAEFLSDKENQNNYLFSFPSEPVKLNSKLVTEYVTNTENDLNSFDGLLVSLTAKPAVVLSVILVQDTVQHQYSIGTYRYGLNSNRYDKAFCNQIQNLKSNQVKFADAAVLDGSIPFPTPNDTWIVEYVAEDMGILPSVDSIELWSKTKQIRENCPSLSNVFSLKFGHISDSSGNTDATLGLVEFLDPAPTNGSLPYLVMHPAFLTEIEFSTVTPPSKPGEFAVDYVSGQVLVFGKDKDGAGTGEIPPTASYWRRKIFQKNLDYFVSSSDSEIVAASGRDLKGSEATLEFVYEKVYAQDQDYIAEVHIETIGERVESNLINQFTIVPAHSPVTDVFAVTNETTGAKYDIAGFDDHNIYIQGANLPKILETEEFAKPVQILDEQIFVAETIQEGLTNSIFKIVLLNSKVAASTGCRIGSSMDSSLRLSSSLFAEEFYYDSLLQDLSTNLLKISVPGDYLVDYQNGIIYTVQANGFSDLGTASYSKADAETINPRVFSVGTIQYKSSQNGDVIFSWDVESTSNGTIAFAEHVVATERFLKQDTFNPVLFCSKQYGTSGSWSVGSNIFSATDGEFTTEFADGSHYLRLVGDSDRLIVSLISKTQVVVDLAFTSTESNIGWNIFDTAPADGYTTTVSHPIKSVRGVYLVDDLQLDSKSNLINYWNPELDTFDGNQILFANSLAKTIPVGTALAVDYDFGSTFIQYSYVEDQIILDYEYGDNQIRWIGDSQPSADSTYFVSYRYGALRRELIENFATITQFDDLITAGIDVDREVIRQLLKGHLKTNAFGPTAQSFSDVGSYVTDITPTISELTFNEWIIGKSHLGPAKPKLLKEPTFKKVKWGNGLLCANNSVSLPAESYISYREGSYFSNTVTEWYGQNNNCSVRFSVEDISLDDVFVAPTFKNPSALDFELSPSVNFSDAPDYSDGYGLYVWFSPTENKWNVALAGVLGKTVGGTIDTDGEIVFARDGYIIGSETFESTDTITSRAKTLRFDFEITSADTVKPATSGLWIDSLSFVASRRNYLFDVKDDGSTGRISLYRDSSGWLSLETTDTAIRPRVWQISKDIRDWAPGDIHSIAASWKFNSPDATDEMHLFVDGREVHNISRFCDSISPTLTRGVGFEILSAPVRPCFLVEGCLTTAGSAVISADFDFVAAGILAGDTVSILDDTDDALFNPYTVLSVTTSSVTLTTNLTLSLTGVRISLNKYTASLSASVESNYIVFVDQVELAGPAADVPAYSVYRDGGINKIDIYGNVNNSSSIELRTVGLTAARNKVFVSLN